MSTMTPDFQTNRIVAEFQFMTQALEPKVRLSSDVWEQRLEGIEEMRVLTHVAFKQIDRHFLRGLADELDMMFLEVSGVLTGMVEVTEIAMVHGMLYFSSKEHTANFMQLLLDLDAADYLFEYVVIPIVANTTAQKMVPILRNIVEFILQMREWLFDHYNDIREIVEWLVDTRPTQAWEQIIGFTRRNLDKVGRKLTHVHDDNTLPWGPQGCQCDNIDDRGNLICNCIVEDGAVVPDKGILIDSHLLSLYRFPSKLEVRRQIARRTT
jgi:hypothetical protein